MVLCVMRYVEVLVVYVAVVFTVCEGCPQDVHIHRFAIGNGLHREVHTVIEWSSANGCNVLLQEFLPQGLYVDVDQLQSIAELGKAKVISNEKINVEVASVQASSHYLWVYTQAVPYASISANRYKLSVAIPMHLRYQPAGEKGYATVTLLSPSILFNCTDNGNTECGNTVMMAPCDVTLKQICRWMEMKPEIKQSTQHLMFDVPIGLKDHQTSVTIATVSSAVMSTLWILITIWKSPNT